MYVRFRLPWSSGETKENDKFKLLQTLTAQGRSLEDLYLTTLNSVADPAERLELIKEAVTVNYAKQRELSQSVRVTWQYFLATLIFLAFGLGYIAVARRNDTATIEFVKGTLTTIIGAIIASVFHRSAKD